MSSNTDTTHGARPKLGRASDSICAMFDVGVHGSFYPAWPDALRAMRRRARIWNRWVDAKAERLLHREWEQRQARKAQAEAIAKTQEGNG